MSRRRPVELVDASVLSPTVRALRLRCTDGEALAFTAGQWIDLYVPTAGGAEVQKRAYSIASAPGGQDAATFDLAVTLVEGGAVSTALHELPLGAALEIEGPFGFFTRTETRHLPALLIGTGTGLAPLRSMLQEELRDPDGPALTLLFGCRTRKDILWREELERWAEQVPRFELHVTLSRPDGDWPGRRGYVQTHLPELVPALGRPHVFACGLTPMIKGVRKVLKQDLGYDRRCIHTERFD
ncbi:MAG: FAD-dependent oxidoreductase [Myxococcales bacterium]|jgi:ferredoxin-NADP reductase